jgi:hypothetical protein
MKEMLEENETVKSSLIFEHKSKLQPAFEGLGTAGETASHSHPISQLIRDHIFNDKVIVFAYFLHVLYN